GWVRFAANVDIAGWEEQSAALRSGLPRWLQCVGEHDVLRFMRQMVDGINMTQLYIKVPGVWTGGHEESCRFRSINCCHGPGASEWGAIEGKYAPRLRELVLQEYGVDIYRSEGEWFPDPEWLRHKGIPAAYGIQRAGDVVVLRGDTLHWVRSLGFSVSSSWNFGHLEARQLEAAFDRYDLNCHLQPPVQNLVPVRTLSVD
ncbi:hypothetical protein JKP88DRAFT_132123, partial [Tribonema minus]